MKQVAKILLIDSEGKYLLLQRSDHPVFPNDPDLPGGTVEEGEPIVAALVREVNEEAGITISPANIELLFAGNESSKHGTEYYLYECHVGDRPPVKISWEHDSYGWVDRKMLLEKTRAAKDTYMCMVADIVERSEPGP